MGPSWMVRIIMACHWRTRESPALRASLLQCAETRIVVVGTALAQFPQSFQQSALFAIIASFRIRVHASC